MSSSMYREEIIIDYENVSYQHQTREFMRHLPAYTKDYVISLFPIATWLHRYNLMVNSYYLFMLYTMEIDHSSFL